VHYKFHFKQCEQNYWDNVYNHKLALEAFYESNSYTSKDNWYDTYRYELVTFGIGGLFLHYKNMYALLTTIYPEIKWDLLKFGVKDWRNKENIEKALFYMRDNEKWTTMEDFYKLSVIICDKYECNGLLVKYSNSPIKLLRDIFPDYEWKEWKFLKSNQCWTDGTKINISMIRSYFDYFYKENNMKSLDDFCDYTVKDFPAGIMGLYKWNLCTCMKAVYTEHKWDEADFQSKNYSKASIRLWNHLMDIILLLTLQHKLNGGEVKIGTYPVDAYYRSDSYEDALCILSQLPSYCKIIEHVDATNIIFQYHGTYWHAHPDYYESSLIHLTRKIECGLIYIETCKITEELSKTHHVVEIWEHEWIH
jgi:hypothetical protein